MLKVYTTPATEEGFTTLQADHATWVKIDDLTMTMMVGWKKNIRIRLAASEPGDIVRVRFADADAAAVLDLVRRATA